MKWVRVVAKSPAARDWALRAWDVLAIIGMALAGAAITATYVVLLCGSMLWTI